jgi:hypothetical protein
LVEIHHQMHVGADGLPHGNDRCQVIVDPLSAQSKFETGEAAFVAQLDCLRPYRFRHPEPQAIAVVAFHRTHRAAQQHAQRHRRCLGQRIPGRHVQSGDGDHGLSLVADEMEGLASSVVQFEGRDAAPLE